MKKSFGGGVVFFFFFLPFFFLVVWVFLVCFFFYPVTRKFLYFIIWNTAIILMKGFKHLKTTDGFQSDKDFNLLIVSSTSFSMKVL